MQSETIGKLAEALSKAQGALTSASKDSKGNYGKYATLAELWDTARAALSNHGLSVMQATDLVGDRLVIRTVIAHTSGEWLDGLYPVKPAQDTPMGLGAALSFARRYTFAAMCGLTAEDSEAVGSAGYPNGNSGNRPTTTGKPAAPKPAVAAPKPAVSQEAASPAAAAEVTGEAEEDLNGLFDGDGFDTSWSTPAHYTAAKAWAEKMAGPEAVASLWPTVFKSTEAAKPANAGKFLMAWREAVNAAA